MFRLERIFYIFVIYCTSHVDYGYGVVQESRDSERIKTGFLFIGKSSFNDGNLIFAVCDKNTTSSTKCNVVQKIYPKKESTHSCLNMLKGDFNESRLSVRIGIITLGKDKAILYWGEDYNNSSITKIGTIDLKTCKMNQVAIPDPTKEVLLDLYYTDKVVAYDDDSFDIFFNDSKQCGEKLCKIQINSDGTANGDPIISNIASGLVHYVSSIATRSSSKGYAYLKKDNMGYTLLLVKPDGKEKQLARYGNNARPVVTANENVVNACTNPNADSNVICTQYDEDGTVKFTITIPAIYNNTQPRVLYNLPDKGILVILVELTQCDPLLNCNESNYHIVKIAANGKNLTKAHIREFDSVTSQWKYTFIYKYNKLEYCAAIIGQDPIMDELTWSNYEIIYHCVTENEFSV